MSRSVLRTEMEKDRTKKKTELDIHFRNHCPRLYTATVDQFE